MSKKIISLLLAVLLCVLTYSPAFSGSKIFTKELWLNQSISSGQSIESEPIELSSDTLGFFSLQIEVSGDGAVKAEYLVSINGSDYVEPAGAADIFSSFTASSGTSGKDIQSFSPPRPHKIKIKITETGGASAVVVSAWLAVQ